MPGNGCVAEPGLVAVIPGSGEIVSTVVLLVGIGFVALLTGSFAQRFLSPEIIEVEEELAAEQISAEVLALRELKSVQEQLQSLEVAVQRLIDERTR